MTTVYDLLQKIDEYKLESNIQRVQKAFDYAVKSYEGLYRLSGDSYIQHALNVVGSLLPFKPDVETIIAALLHELPHCPRYNLEEMKENFGTEVMDLVTGMAKLQDLPIRDSSQDLDALRRLILSFAKDLRLIVIRLADLLDDAETLQYLDENMRRGALITIMDVYVPIAARLGMYSIKCRLEDAAFRYLYPERYADLKLELEQYFKKHEKVIDQVKKELESLLVNNGVEARIDGRLKNLYSIYKKLKRKNKSLLQEVYDIFAFRVILPTQFNKDGTESTASLYTLLGLIHSRWIPLPNRFKDYIAVPKPNGYKSLHTTVMGFLSKPYDQPIEIQIRSENMHQEAEFGASCHWLYEDTKGFCQYFRGGKMSGTLKMFTGRTLEEKLQRYKNWLEGLARLQGSLSTGEGIMKPLNVNFFEDRIFVFTPTGEVKDLPKGATPVDFAYAVHTNIGQHCYSAKVNGSIVPLDYPLKNADVVEILTRNTVSPKPHWLSFVKTGHAREKIKSFLKSLDQEGSGLKAGMVPSPVVTAQPAVIPRKKNSGIITPKLPKDKTSSILIGGEADVPYKLSQCCKPELGSPIIAYVTRGRSVRIHQVSCKFLKNANPERILDAAWAFQQDHRQIRRPVKIQIKALDRVGLIRDIADVVAGFNINIVDFSLIERKDNLLKRQVVIEITDDEQFKKIMESLSQIRNVLDVKGV